MLFIELQRLGQNINTYYWKRNILMDCLEILCLWLSSCGLLTALSNLQSFRTIFSKTLLHNSKKRDFWVKWERTVFSALSLIFFFCSHSLIVPKTLRLAKVSPAVSVQQSVSVSSYIYPDIMVRRKAFREQFQTLNIRHTRNIEISLAS